MRQERYGVNLVMKKTRGQLPPGGDAGNVLIQPSSRNSTAKSCESISGEAERVAAAEQHRTQASKNMIRHPKLSNVLN